MSLDDFRKEINALDHQLVELVGRRLDICRRVAAFKKASGIAMMQPDRVVEVKRRCADLGVEHGLSRDYVERLYTLIIDESCRLEDEIIGQPEADSGR